MMSFFKSENIPHYHGDEVRRYFFAVVAISFIATPLWGDVLPIPFVIQVAAGIGFIVLAGATAPHSKVILVLDAFAAAVGAFLLEVTAIGLYGSDSAILFVVREANALLLALALYASVKTLRAMAQKKIGASSQPEEFVSKKTDT